MPNHRSRGKTVGERIPQCQLWGLLASGRSTLGPLSCRRGLLERKFEYVMDVGSIQHTHLTQPTVNTYGSTLCRACGGSFVGTGDEWMWAPPSRGLRPLKRIGNRSADNLHNHTVPTVTDVQRPGLGPLVRRGFWPMGQSSSIQSAFHKHVFGSCILDVSSLGLM